MAKLNLGCGSKIKEGWINIDLNPPEYARFLHNKLENNTIIIQKNVLEIGTLWADNTFDLIVSEFMFEHFSPAEISKMLYICWKLLKPKGILKIVVPDFVKAIKYFEDNKPQSWASVNGVTLEVFGDDFETPHRSVWTEEFAYVYIEGENLFYIRSIEPDVATNRHYALMITASVIKES